MPVGGVENENAGRPCGVLAIGSARYWHNRIRSFARRLHVVLVAPNPLCSPVSARVWCGAVVLLPRRMWACGDRLGVPAASARSAASPSVKVSAVCGEASSRRFWVLVSCCVLPSSKCFLPLPSATPVSRVVIYPCLWCYCVQPLPVQSTFRPMTWDAMRWQPTACMDLCCIWQRLQERA